jgi:hypothetical protein
MDRAQYKALFNETIKTWRLEGKRFNLDDALYEAELAEIEKEKHARNGNGNGSEPRVMCWCDEGKVNGRRVAVHTPADCEYTARRSALVYEASRIATERVGDARGACVLGYKWTAEFVRVMNQLAFNAGLIK